MSTRMAIVSQRPGSNKSPGSLQRTNRCIASGPAKKCGLRLPKRPELRILKGLGGKLAVALRLRRRPSAKVSSSANAKPFVAPVDSHRAEAIEDCIEFINSTSSLCRSNSVNANCG
ncbi:josephin-like protein [Tripterygium wilfordii]|uniref:Josephin-like protein n=1 Tax=Tripterygium wilfordii TaxID=458696 RepID=A0A7J7DDT8_TRIWF|nr:josephin-like protein [Tripterygium wilfordii]KAF5744527.1 josephin-like protein [Tripterygium wilfordii]